jgi:hypothetical protein
LGEHPVEFSEVQEAVRNLVPLNEAQMMVVHEIASLEFCLRERTGVTPTVREECPAQTAKQRTFESLLSVMSRMSIVDRLMDQKIRLLLTLQNTAPSTVGLGSRTAGAKKTRTGE